MKKKRKKMRRYVPKKGWFYGIIRKVYPSAAKSEEVQYEIHEVFPWGKNGRLMWTSEPITVSGESVKSVRWALRRMLEDSYHIPVFEVKGKNLVTIKEERR